MLFLFQHNGLGDVTVDIKGVTSDINDIRGVVGDIKGGMFL